MALNFVYQLFSTFIPYEDRAVAPSTPCPMGSAFERRRLHPIGLIRESLKHSSTSSLRSKLRDTCIINMLIQYITHYNSFRAIIKKSGSYALKESNPSPLPFQVYTFLGRGEKKSKILIISRKRCKYPSTRSLTFAAAADSLHT